ncbi:Carboxylesterase NlhH [Planctomycetes bacterium K23_9]|uniref:Carboxylesterase NlhH n=2 Tax=Stieleria marina TaxID=1930275 RepID=A0A517NZN7_9BACT|nr:Carboxylesterase NlhH [Planctomycetes bacterium K23_9]
MLVRAFVLMGCVASLAGWDESTAHAEESAMDLSPRVLHEVREKIVYHTVGGRELLLDAYLPETPGVFPAVLVIHGGAWREGNRKQLRQYAAELASRGFCCFAVDYRLAPKHKFPAQIDDCRAAVKWIRENSDVFKVDPKRLGAIGYSAGGHLATLLGTTGESANDKNGNVDMRIQAIVAGGAPTDFRWFPDKGRWAEYWMGGNLDSVPEKFQAASAAAFVDAKDPPTFFFNGTKDKIVPLIWTQACHLAMKDAGVKTELYVIEGAGHIQAASDKTALSKACDFLVGELQTIPPTEALPTVPRSTSAETATTD